MDAQRPPQSTKWMQRASTSGLPSKPRNVDRELMRIKSLAVVSGLKAYTQEPQSFATGGPPSPTLSATSAPQRLSNVPSLADMRRRRAPSVRSSTSSLQLENHSVQAKRRSKGYQRLKAAELDQLEQELIAMFEELQNQHNEVEDRVAKWVVNVLPSVSSKPLSEVDGAERQHAAAEEDTPTDRQAEEYEKLYAAMVERQKHADQHMQHTTAIYLEQKETESAKVRQLSDVLTRQDQLIQHLESHLDQALERNAALQSWLDKQTWTQDLVEAHQQLGQLRQEVATLTHDKKELRDRVQWLISQLQQAQSQLQEATQTTDTLKTECESLRSEVENKLEPLQRQLLEKETQIKMLRAAASNRGSREFSNSSSSKESRLSLASVLSNTLPRVFEKTDSVSRQNSTATANGKRSYIARWTGGPLPPPVPPPSQPLPPVPTETAPMPETSTATAQAAREEEGEQAKGEPVIILHEEPASPVKDDGDGQSSLRSTASTFMDDAESIAAYREFAEQLQARLSISKEIDDLQVWRPDDMEEMQRRIDSDWAQDPKRHSLLSKDLWKGMKKKLRG